MSRNSRQTWDAIAACNLVPPSIRTRVERSKNFADLVGSDSPKPLLSTLVKANILSEFQARTIYAGKESELIQANWIVRQQLTSLTWEGWFVGTPAGQFESIGMTGGAEVGPEQWIRLVSHEEIRSKPALLPSRERHRKLKHANSRHLVSFQVSKWEGRGYSIAFSANAGSLLTEFDRSPQSDTTDAVRSSIWLQLIRSAYQGLADIQALDVGVNAIHADLLLVPAHRSANEAEVQWIIDPLFEIDENTPQSSTASSFLWQTSVVDDVAKVRPLVNRRSQEAWQLTDTLYHQLATRGTGLAAIAERLKNFGADIESGLIADAEAAVRYWSDAANGSASNSIAMNAGQAVDHASGREPSAVVAAPAVVNTSDIPQPATVLKRRKKRKSPLFLAVSIVIPIISLAVGALVWLGMSSDGKVESQAKQTTATSSENQSSPSQPPDERLNLYRVSQVASDHPWLPPLANKPIDLQGFPSGGQMFFVLHPSRLVPFDSGDAAGENRSAVQQEREELKHLFQTQWEQFGEWFERKVGLPLASAEQVTVAVYPKPGVNAEERYVLQIRLKEAMSEQDWLLAIDGEPSATEKQMVARKRTNEVVWVLERDAASAIRSFTVGPATDMQEVVESAGEPFYLPPQMEQLNGKSHQDYDIVLLVTPRFLTGDQRGLLTKLPARASNWLRTLLSDDARAVLIQLQFNDPWYAELSWIGASDIDAGRKSEWMAEQFANAGDAMERWIVSSVPDPAWRGLAIRMPTILRALADYSRIGVEDGSVVSNVYLPVESASDIIGGLWLIGQDWTATPAIDLIADEQGAKNKTWTIQEFLESKIRVSFDQESIEVALQLAGSQSNTLLNASEGAVEFILDGSAFERDGITRNQQLKNFALNERSVRDVLTEIAKRGNPVTTVTDLRQSDQKLLWVVLGPADDGTWESVEFDESLTTKPLRVMLTTRAEAEKNSWKLPDEFRSQSP